MKTLKRLIAGAASMFGFSSLYRFYPPKGQKLHYDKPQRFVREKLKKPLPHQVQNK